MFNTYKSVLQVNIALYKNSLINVTNISSGMKIEDPNRT